MTALGGRRRAALAIGLCVALLGGVAVGPAVGPVRASGEIGPYYGAQVRCNPYDNVIEMYPRAGAYAGFESQWIYTRMWLWQDGVGWRTDLAPMTEMFRHDRVTHYRDVMGDMPSYTTHAVGNGWTARPGEGSFAVYTEYQWWDGYAWTSPLGVWTEWIEYSYSLAPNSTIWCNLTLV